MKKFKNLISKYNIKYEIDKICLNFPSVKDVEISNVRLKPVGLSDFPTFNKKIKIRFIKKLTPLLFNYLSVEDTDIFITNKIKEKNFFLKNKLILLSHTEFAENKSLNIKVKEKNVNREINFLHFDIGYGPEYMYFLIPKWKNKKNYNFQTYTTSFLNKILNLGYPKGLRVKIIISEIQYMNDINEIVYKLGKPKILIVSDTNFLGNFKILYKYNGNRLFNDLIFSSILKIKSKFGFKIEFLTINKYDYFLPQTSTLWINPFISNDEILLSEKNTEEYSSIIYSIINNIPKYLIR